MSGAARRVIETFDSLPEPEKQEVLVEILRKELADYESADDADLVFVAEQVFLDLDRREENR